jgi:2-dehydropantoate 2-reductase
MRILIVGAGATGGYFGARLLQHGRDVTFLVRAGRAGQLAEHGLVVRSDAGNVDLPPPSTVSSQDLRDPFDLIVLGCKAYALEQALIDIAPAVGPHSTILPLLNGMRHLDRLDEKFGAQRALGGQCVISATLDDDGVVRHLNRMHSITFGERDGESSVRMGDITRELSDAGFDARPSERIVQEMWDSGSSSPRWRASPA